jgi:hypothetical protein
MARFVIPAQAEIQLFRYVLDTGLRNLKVTRPV